MCPRRYGRGKFEAHPDYVQYMIDIVKHPNYKDMPNAVSEDGHVNWQVSTGKTTSFYKFYEERFSWWVKKADSLGVPGTGNSLDRFSITARRIHPIGYRPCRLCGKTLNVGYFYINYFLASKWNYLVHNNIFVVGQPINDAVSALIDVIGIEKATAEIYQSFPERKHFFDSEGITKKGFEASNYIRSRFLSPGFMCNPPDRLDGFHDYGLCCRKRSDPGRSDENLRSYQHDRRTFMWWAEGDWMIADELYNKAGGGFCTECGRKVEQLSPDHIGPLSCGFKQIPFFRPLCSSCNSSKNRRMSASDIKRLQDYEKAQGTSVASWQVRSLWDRFKNEIKTDSEAKALSTAMRALEDYYLRMLDAIYKAGRSYFLATLLSPEFAYDDIEFVNLDPTSFTFDRVIVRKRITPNRQSLAARMVRIAFEELEAYVGKPFGNRKIKKYFLEPYGHYFAGIIESCKKHELGELAVKWNSVLASSVPNELKEEQILYLLHEKDDRELSNYKEIKNQMEQVFDLIGKEAKLL